MPWRERIESWRGRLIEILNDPLFAAVFTVGSFVAALVLLVVVGLLSAPMTDEEYRAYRRAVGHPEHHECEVCRD